MFHYIYIGLPIFFLFFIINLETDKKMGNIWYRINSKGFKQVNLTNIIPFLYLPLYNYHFWLPNMWINNIYLSSIVFLYFLISLDFKFKNSKE